MANNYAKVAQFRTLESFREFLKNEQINIGLADLPPPEKSALAQKLEYNNRTIGNRWAILPMEGWDCTDDGSPGEYTRRRWLNFASSGAKLIYGTEAAAVMHSGRSNPQQLMAAPHTQDALKELNQAMRKTHKDKFGQDDDLLIGLQLTHSGRYSHPNEAAKLESVTAYSNPLLDKKFGNTPANVVSDKEIGNIVKHFIQAAVVAQNAGFDFVDIKQAHGYLAHEFLSAYDRPGPYGGSFENRTRFFREIAGGIQKAAPGLELSARLSIFDIRPFIKGEDGVGKPMDWEGDYPYAFGSDASGMDMDENLTEVVKFVKLMQEYGVKLICATIGSPYYCVHMQRPAYFPVADGYEMPAHPLYNVYRHIKAVARLKELCPEIKVVGSGYTCLQEYLPNAAEYAVANNMTDFVGIGRMVLSYPDMPADLLAGKPLDRCRICRTFGDCTNAPRHGMISGCYPLDHFYKQLPEAEKLKVIKNNKR